MHQRHINLRYVLLGLVIFLMMPGIAVAAITDNNVLDGIVAKYRDASAQWTQIIRPHALNLFWLLAAIDFTWSGINLTLKRTDLGDFVAELVRRMMFIGFFLALIQYSGDWPKRIVDSFRAMANEASTGSSNGITPSTIFDIGLTLASSITQSVSFTAPGASLALVLSTLIIFICFTLIAAYLLVSLVEMYVAINAGVILLGFGGSRWTSNYATQYMTYMVSVGMKLFSMQLLIAIGQSFLSDAYGHFEPSNAQVFILIGISVVLLVLIKTIPDILQSLVNGGSFGSGGGHMLASSAMAMAGGAVAGAASGGLAGYEAAKLASSQGHTGVSRIVGTAANLARASAGDVAARFAGVPGANMGTHGGRMASQMREQRQSKAPPPPSAPQDMPTSAPIEPA